MRMRYVQCCTKKVVSWHNSNPPHSVCRLHHQPTPHDPHIDYHDSDDQRRNTQPPFIAMTLLLCDVSQLRKEAQLTRLAMWEVFVLMLRAMRGVHEGRILHRDVKPSNFGLAHAAWSSSINGSASPPLPLPASSATDSRCYYTVFHCFATAAISLYHRLRSVYQRLHLLVLVLFLIIPVLRCYSHTALSHLIQRQIPLRFHRPSRSQATRPLRRSHHATLHRTRLPTTITWSTMEDCTR